MFPHSCDAQRRDTVDESLRLPGDGSDAFVGGGRDEGNEVHPTGGTVGLHFLLFLKGDIWQDHTVHPGILAGGKKALRPIGKYRIGVAEKHQGHIGLFPDAPHQLKQAVGGHTRLKGPLIGPLDLRTLRHGIGKRYPQLDQIGSRLRHGGDQLFRQVLIGIPRRNKGNKCLAVGKGLPNTLIHTIPPLCNGRWPPRPCLPGPTD